MKHQFDERPPARVMSVDLEQGRVEDIRRSNIVSLDDWRRELDARQHCVEESAEIRKRREQRALEDAQKALEEPSGWRAWAKVPGRLAGAFLDMLRGN